MIRVRVCASADGVVTRAVRCEVNSLESGGATKCRGRAPRPALYYAREREQAARFCSYPGEPCTSLAVVATVADAYLIDATRYSHL